jgi:hypothetical protein
LRGKPAGDESYYGQGNNPGQNVVGFHYNQGDGLVGQFNDVPRSVDQQLAQ